MCPSDKPPNYLEIIVEEDEDVEDDLDDSNYTLDSVEVQVQFYEFEEEGDLENYLSELQNNTTLSSTPSNHPSPSEGSLMNDRVSPSDEEIDQGSMPDKVPRTA